MKSYFPILLWCLVCISCTKKENNHPKYSIADISGNYKGGNLSWNKTTGGINLKGNDSAFTFSVSYLENDSVQLTINTTAPVTNNVYLIPLTGTQEVPQSMMYAFSATVPFMGTTLVIQLAVIIFADPSTSTLASFTFGYPNNAPEYFEGTGKRY